MPDRLVVDLDAMELAWPLGDAARGPALVPGGLPHAPFGVYEDRGGRVEARLAGWGRAVFGAVFGSGAMPTEIGRPVLRSASPALLGLPWELMVAPGARRAAGPGRAGVSR